MSTASIACTFAFFTTGTWIICTMDICATRMRGTMMSMFAVSADNPDICAPIACQCGHDGCGDGARARPEGVEALMLRVQMRVRVRPASPFLTQPGFVEAPACYLPFQASGRPDSPSPRVGEGGRRDAHRGRFFGKPLRAISRFRHQDAQIHPSPRVEEGGRRDEGQKRSGMQKITQQHTSRRDHRRSNVRARGPRSLASTVTEI